MADDKLVERLNAQVPKFASDTVWVSLRQSDLRTLLDRIEALEAGIKEAMTEWKLAEALVTLRRALEGK